MQKNNSFFEDMAKVAGSAASTMLEMRHEVERVVHSQMEQIVQKMNLVSREEFDVVREMAQKAREENEALRQELAALKKPAAAKKTAAKSTTKKAAGKK